MPQPGPRSSGTRRSRALGSATRRPSPSSSPGSSGSARRPGSYDVGVVAVDGTKLAASASDGAIRSYEQIAREILAEAGRIDAAEDEIHGSARGDELPEGLRTPNGRRAWLREAKEELKRERASNPDPVQRDRARRLETCRRRLAEDWQAERRANRRYEAYRARDHGGSNRQLTIMPLAERAALGALWRLAAHRGGSTARAGSTRRTKKTREWSADAGKPPTAPAFPRPRTRAGH